MDAETIYYALREVAEQHGFVTEAADELLGSAAEAIIPNDEVGLV